MRSASTLLKAIAFWNIVCVCVFVWRDLQCEISHVLHFRIEVNRCWAINKTDACIWNESKVVSEDCSYVIIETRLIGDCVYDLWETMPTGEPSLNLVWAAIFFFVWFVWFDFCFSWSLRFANQNANACKGFIFNELRQTNELTQVYVFCFAMTSSSRYSSKLYMQLDRFLYSHSQHMYTSIHNTHTHHR